MSQQEAHRKELEKYYQQREAEMQQRVADMQKRMDEMHAQGAPEPPHPMTDMPAPGPGERMQVPEDVQKDWEQRKAEQAKRWEEQKAEERKEQELAANRRTDHGGGPPGFGRPRGNVIGARGVRLPRHRAEHGSPARLRHF